MISRRRGPLFGEGCSIAAQRTPRTRRTRAGKNRCKRRVCQQMPFDCSSRTLLQNVYLLGKHVLLEYWFKLILSLRRNGYPSTKMWEAALQPSRSLTTRFQKIPAIACVNARMSSQQTLCVASECICVRFPPASRSVSRHSGECGDIIIAQYSIW